MLVVTRKAGERIAVAAACVVTVIAINGKRVRLGIVAEDGTEIVREELLVASGRLLTEFVADAA